MKVIEKQGKQVLSLSYEEWLVIGKSFKVKSHIKNNNLRYASRKFEGEYLPLEELISRLGQLGFDIRWTDSHHSVKATFSRPAPLKPISINAAVKEYDNNGWTYVKGDLRKSDNDLLTFLYNKEFKIPANLDLETMKLKKKEAPEYIEKKIPFATLNPDLLTGNNPYEILMDNKWHDKIEDIDYSTMTIMDESGDLHQLPSLNSLVTLRKKM